jgi:hypothetical protein
MFLLVMSCGETTPPPVKRPSLVNSAAFAPEHREALSAVTRFIVQKGEDPLDFFAEVTQSPNTDELVFRLWHASTFNPQSTKVIGNPGGKNRDVYYDVKARKVTRMVFWQ